MDAAIVNPAPHGLRCFYFEFGRGHGIDDNKILSTNAMT